MYLQLPRALPGRMYMYNHLAVSGYVDHRWDTGSAETAVCKLLSNPNAGRVATGH